MKDKIIEEMAKAIEFAINNECKLNNGKTCEECKFDNQGDWSCQNIMVATHLHGEGYRKIPEDFITVSEFEYKDLKYRLNRAMQYNSLLQKEIDELKEELSTCVEIKNQARKETAKQIYITGKYYYNKHCSKDVALNRFADWIKETYEVGEEE